MGKMTTYTTTRYLKVPCIYCNKEDCEIFDRFAGCLYSVFGHPDEKDGEYLKVDLLNQIVQQYLGDTLTASFSLEKGNSVMLNYFQRDGLREIDPAFGETIVAVASQYTHTDAHELQKHGIQIWQ